MSALRLFWITVAVALSVLLVSLAINRETIRDVVADCYQAGCFDLEKGRELAELAKVFVNDTRFEGRVNVDGAPRLDALNIYVANQALPRRLQQLECNCAYVGANTVICDQKFLSSFSNSLAFTRGSVFGSNADEIWSSTQGVLEKTNEITATVLTSWILGHEIGHAVLHSDYLEGRRRAITRTEEQEADAFFLGRASGSAEGYPPTRDLEWAISQMIFQIIVLTYEDGKARIQPSRDGVHDPWLLRALSLGQSLVDVSDDPESDYYSSLAEAVVIDLEGGSAGSFCSLANIREGAATEQLRRLNEE